MASFNIETFKSSMNGGGFTKANRYELKINIPPMAAGGNLSDLSLRIDSLSLPGKQIATTEVKYYGPTRKSPYGMIYEDLSFNVILSRNLIERKILSDWMNYIFEYDTALLNFYKTYITTLEFTSYTETSESMQYKVVFEEAYPISIGSIQYAYDNDTLARLPVTFAYRKWGQEETGSSPQTTGGKSASSNAQQPTNWQEGNWPVG